MSTQIPERIFSDAVQILESVCDLVADSAEVPCGNVTILPKLREAIAILGRPIPQPGTGLSQQCAADHVVLVDNPRVQQLEAELAAAKSCPQSTITDEQLRVKVAELNGWKFLNACAFLRAGLSEEERQRFCVFLEDETGAANESRMSFRGTWLIANATARQHCLAFLRAKNIEV